MPRVISGQLNTADITRMIKQLEDYNNELMRKCEELVNELADIGIRLAESRLSGIVDESTLIEGNTALDFSDMVWFEKRIDPPLGDTVTGLIIPYSQPYIKTWQGGSAQVDPLLMAEFGSGNFAIDGHRGTFPNQKHADQDKWGWKEVGSDEIHWSSGVIPTRPIFYAVEEMRNEIDGVVARVFGTS